MERRISAAILDWGAILLKLAAANVELEKRVHALEVIDKLQERKEREKPLRPRTWTQARALLEQGGTTNVAADDNLD
jgi:hypothetical protein